MRSDNPEPGALSSRPRAIGAQGLRADDFRPRREHPVERGVHARASR